MRNYAILHILCIKMMLIVEKSKSNCIKMINDKIVFQIETKVYKIKRWVLQVTQTILKDTSQTLKN